MPETAVGNKILIEKGAKSLFKRKSTGKAILNDLFKDLKSSEKKAEPGKFKQVSIL
jgi:hypothetical protein